MHQPMGKIYIFRSFKTPMTSILKQVEIKIVGGHSRFQKLRKDKQKTCLELYKYQDCRIS